MAKQVVVTYAFPNGGVNNTLFTPAMGAKKWMKFIRRDFEEGARILWEEPGLFIILTDDGVLTSYREIDEE